MDWQQNQFGDFNLQIDYLTAYTTQWENCVEACLINSQNSRPFTDSQKRTFSNVESAKQWLENLIHKELEY